MKHIFEQGTHQGAPTLLLLHGTGGTERDLLPVARVIDPSASVLGVRGSVLENGMPRFFRRLAEGIFDEEDLVLRTGELQQFLDEAAQQYGFDRSRVIAVGYSNGANIAASLLLHIAGSLGGAILHHPMVPRRGINLPDMTGLPIFIGAGKNDPLVTTTETEELKTTLEQAGASVELHWEGHGHQLTATEIEAAAMWYREHFQ